MNGIVDDIFGIKQLSLDIAIYKASRKHLGFGLTQGLVDEQVEMLEKMKSDMVERVITSIICL